MKTILNLTNKILVVFLMALLLSCNNQSNKKYKSCEKVLKEHIKVVENSTDCDKLERYYNETGKARGWEHCRFFLLLYHPDIPGFENVPGFMNLYLKDINDNKLEKLQALHDELKSTIEKRFIQLNCTSEVIRAYMSFYEELNAAIVKCSDYKEYNALVKDVADCMNSIYEDDNNECYWQNYVSSFALHRFVKASKNVTPEEDPIVTKIVQDFNNRISSIVSDFEAEEQYELQQKELFENSTLREKLHWLTREGAEKEWDELIDSNTIEFGELCSNYKNVVKSDKAYLGNDMIVKIKVDEIKPANSGKYAKLYSYEVRHSGLSVARFFTNDESFTRRDYPCTVWIIAKCQERDLDGNWSDIIFTFTDAELLAWSK